MIFSLSACLAPDPALSPSAVSADQTPGKSWEQQTTAPPHLDPDILAKRAFSEAPQLRARVQTGELPPVSDRLPEHPLVVVPIETIGRYGGTLRRALSSDISQWPGISKAISENLLAFSNPMGERVEPNLAENWAFEDSGRTAIFHLRKGIRWSDGHPFTVHDILFYYYDMIFDENARASDLPTPPPEWLIDGKPLALSHRGDDTLIIQSPKPMGRLLYTLGSASDFAAPKHHWRQFHPKYTPGASYGDFRQMTTRAQQLMTPGVPRLSAWVTTEWVRGQRLVYQRNPYYWKIDSEGQQLPYADRIDFNIIGDTQVILLKFINGEIDLFGRYARINMFPTLRVEEQKGRFELRITGPDRGPAFYINWDAPGAALREAFRNRDVRIALSLAINREEINEIVFHGLLAPSGYAFAPSNPFFSEETYRQYADFDPEQANRLLDQAGYRDTNGDGWRAFKDGSRFEFNIDVTPGEGVDVCQLVAEHWRDIGLKVNLNIALRDIIWPRRLAGDFDIHQWGFEGPDDPIGRMNDWAIMAPTVPFWHRNASAEGPDWLREATHHIQSVLTTVDTARVRHHMTRVRDLHTHNVPVLVVGSTYSVWGASTRLGNVPRQGTNADEFRGWSRPVFHEQIYIK